MARVLDLFAGGGGFSLGFRWAGLAAWRAVENFKPRAATYAANHPDVDLVTQDVQTYVDREPFDVVIGGPPCEPYTSANPKRQARPLDRLYQDRIGSLVLQFVRIVGDARPAVFVMENVVQVAEGELGAELARLLAGRGYPELHFNELLAEHAGVPSHRRRLFLSNVPLSVEPRRRPPTVAQALDGLPEPGTVPKGSDAVPDQAAGRDRGGVPNHEPHPLTADKRERIASLRVGEALYSYRSAKGKRHGNWLRLDPDRPAPTVLGGARFVHWSEPRLLTPREHARLMGYPDDYVLAGGRHQQYESVGESVPPPLAKVIGARVKAAL